MTTAHDTKPLATVEVGGAPIARLTERECVEYILAESAAGRGGWAITPNVDHLQRARRDPEFRCYLQRADLVVADGMPLVWASRLRGEPLPERVAGSNLLSSLCAGAAHHGRSVFLLGGNPGASEGAARVLTARHPTLDVRGIWCPPMGFESCDAELERIGSMLEECQPAIVFVALGSPKQERLISSLLLSRRTALPPIWWLGVGASLSFLAGDIQRAPLWLQALGLEWLHRLFQEPSRLAKRYLVDDLPFALHLLARAAFDRVRESLRLGTVAR